MGRVLIAGHLGQFHPDIDGMIIGPASGPPGNCVSFLDSLCKLLVGPFLAVKQAANGYQLGAVIEFFQRKMDVLESGFHEFSSYSSNRLNGVDATGFVAASSDPKEASYDWSSDEDEPLPIPAVRDLIRNPKAQFPAVSGHYLRKCSRIAGKVVRSDYPGCGTAESWLFNWTNQAARSMRADRRCISR